ncbi:MAG: GNAT family N-acetyltransferase [Myxococcota bacterium]
MPIGWLILDGLDDAPSGDRGLADVGDEPVDVGSGIVEAAIGNGAWLWVADEHEGIAGGVRVTGRELQRSRHVGDLVVLVHPTARRRGVGTALVKAIVEAARNSSRFSKLSARVAADDEALRRTLMASGPWELERVEIGALARGAARVDVHVFGLQVGQ